MIEIKTIKRLHDNDGEAIIIEFTTGAGRENWVRYDDEEAAQKEGWVF
jgi:hypothetical protein